MLGTGRSVRGRRGNEAYVVLGVCVCMRPCDLHMYTSLSLGPCARSFKSASSRPLPGPCLLSPWPRSIFSAYHNDPFHCHRISLYLALRAPSLLFRFFVGQIYLGMVYYLSHLGCPIPNQPALDILVSCSAPHPSLSLPVVSGLPPSLFPFFPFGPLFGGAPALPALPMPCPSSGCVVRAWL
jgi:hypothetical protein